MPFVTRVPRAGQRAGSSRSKTMTKHATTVCGEPGCHRLSPHTRCDQHRTRRPHTDHRPTARARGYNERWKRTRDAYLHRHPWCEHVDQHAQPCTMAATDVHHLDLRGPLGPRGHDPRNLQALCHSHHSMITRRNQIRSAA